MLLKIKSSCKTRFECAFSTIEFSKLTSFKLLSRFEQTNVILKLQQHEISAH